MERRRRFGQPFRIVLGRCAERNAQVVGQALDRKAFDLEQFDLEPGDGDAFRGEVVGCEAFDRKALDRSTREILDGWLQPRLNRAQARCEALDGLGWQAAQHRQAFDCTPQREQSFAHDARAGWFIRRRQLGWRRRQRRQLG